MSSSISGVGPSLPMGGNIQMAAAMKVVQASEDVQAQALEMIEKVCLPDNCTFSTYA